MTDVYQLKVTLRGVTPAVWRRILVPGTTKLCALHAVICTAMGWSGYHLYEFVAAGRHYGQPEDEFDQDIIDADHRRLADIAIVGAWFTHNYDLGDGWEHRVEIESVSEVGGKVRPSCVAGQNACPPEDVGGPDGYAEFLAAIRDPQHQNHADMLIWIGGAFDPAAFDLAGTNALVSRTTRSVVPF